MSHKRRSIVQSMRRAELRLKKEARAEKKRIRREMKKLRKQEPAVIT
jgi:hypothetical protein